MKQSINIGMVIVTYNRLNLLKEVLKKCDMQTKEPEYVLVVNNASNDGTSEYLKQWEVNSSKYKRIVIHLEQNMGGSGGFYTGLEMAQKLNADWIWVSDDDAFPQENALEQTEKYLKNNINSIQRISAVCGMIVNNGEIDIEHRKSIQQRGLLIKEEKIPKSMYGSNFEINAFSYVGSIINKEKLLEAGLPEKYFFIWYDDTEHSLRLSKKGKIICIPDIKIYHNTENEKEILSWKTYYGCRNMAYTYKKHFSKGAYRYFYIITLFKIFIKMVLRYNMELNRIQLCAIRDAEKGKLGIHEKYKPGWKLQDNNFKRST